MNKAVRLMKEYKRIEDKMNSPWCDSTWRCKEGYGELGEIRKKLNLILEEIP